MMLRRMFQSLSFLDVFVCLYRLIPLPCHSDHVFFYSYVQVPPKPGGGLWSAVEELARVNTLLLKNFLDALVVASIKPKRIMLQTGAKNYG